MYAFLNVADQTIHFVEDVEGYSEPDWEALPDPPDWEIPHNWTGTSWEINLDPYWKSLRDERHQRMLDCDWTQSGDQSEEVSELWRPYRQALRDLPATTVDPINPIWPTPPV